MCKKEGETEGEKKFMSEKMTSSFRRETNIMLMED